MDNMFYIYELFFFVKHSLIFAFIYQLLAFMGKYMQFQCTTLLVKITEKFENYEDTIFYWYDSNAAEIEYISE